MFMKTPLPPARHLQAWVANPHATTLSAKTLMVGTERQDDHIGKVEVNVNNK